jgi:ubiquinone/menaquinone biosynthesis C-methylase UbiE
MQRVLEEELMVNTAQVQAYAQADFTQPNQAFCDFLFQQFPRLPSACKVIDLGCGPGDIVRRLAAVRPHWHFTAVDGSAAMLEQARSTLGGATLHGRVDLVCSRLPDLPPTVDQNYDLILSNSLLHHLADPSVLWSAVRSLGKPGAAVLVGDLLRPESPEAAHAIVETYSGTEPEVLKRDFFQSLCAAFRRAEIEEQLGSAGLDCLQFEQVSDRHGYVFGVMPI